VHFQPAPPLVGKVVLSRQRADVAFPALKWRQRRPFRVQAPVQITPVGKPGVVPRNPKCEQTAECPVMLYRYPRARGRVITASDVFHPCGCLHQPDVGLELRRGLADIV